MIIKRIFMALLVVCFLSLAAAPSYADRRRIQQDDSDNANKIEAVIAGSAILIALALWYHFTGKGGGTSAKNDSEQDQQNAETDTEGLDVGLSFANAGYNTGDSFAGTEDEWRSPELSIGFTW
jgi:hypothetical protein